MSETQKNVLPEHLQRREAIRRAYEGLMGCTWSTDSPETQQRLEVLRSLEKEMKKDFQSTRQLKESMDVFFAGHDRRRLPVHQRIRRARRKMSLTQVGLARRLGFRGHSAINQYEKGKRQPTQKVLDWLAEAEVETIDETPADQPADPDH